MKNGNKRVPRRAIVIEEELWERVKEAARREHVSAGQYTRMALREKLGES